MDMDSGNECEVCKTYVKHGMQLIFCTKYDTHVCTVNAIKIKFSPGNWTCIFV